MSEGPEVAVQQIGLADPAGPGLWRMTWRVQNLGDTSVEIAETWLPHGRFRAERQAWEAPQALRPTDGIEMSFKVSCQEDPGTIVENAFVILTVRWQGEPWRVLARLTVAWTAAGVPEARTELVTAQHVGFSTRS